LDLKELLEKQEITVIKVKRRLYILKCFEKELKKTTKKKKYRVRNDIILSFFHDTWDMLVIDLSSLSLGMLGKSGFFNQIKANLDTIKPLHRKDIVPPKGSVQFVGYTPTQEDLDRVQLNMERSHIEDMLKANRDTLFDLFPEAKNRGNLKIRATDVDDLKGRFEKLISDVVNDRHKNRAHRFEYNKNSKDIDVQKVSFDKLNKTFNEIESLLNKLRMVMDQSTFLYSNMLQADPEETAKDLIKMLLWGSNKRIDTFSGINKRLVDNSSGPLSQSYGYILREELISKSHNYHEKILNGDIEPDNLDIEKIDNSEFCFNDVYLPKFMEIDLV